MTSHCKLLLTSGFTTLAFVLATPALAQSAPEQAEDGEVTVTGPRPIAESEASALAIQSVFA